MRQVRFRIHQGRFGEFQRGFPSRFSTLILLIGQQKQYAADTLVIKQDLTVHDVKLSVRVVCKKFVSGFRSVILWEGLCQWLTPTDGMTTTTHEQGSILIEPLESLGEGSGVSIAKGFVRLTPIYSSSHLAQDTRALTEIVLPSYQKVIDARNQYIENHLMDSIMNKF